MKKDGLTHENRMFERLFGKIDHDDEGAVELRTTLGMGFLGVASLAACALVGTIEYAPGVLAVVGLIPVGLLTWAGYRDEKSE